MTQVLPSRAPRAGAASIALSCLAAVAVAAACLVAPGQLAPPIATLLGAGAALGAAALAVWTLRRPALVAFAPPAALLVAALAGIAATAGAAAAPLAAMGGPELVLRCLSAALAIGILAALSPFPNIARALAGAAFGVPGLLTLVWVLFAAASGLSGGAQGLAVAGLLVIYLALLALWGAYLRRSQALELAHWRLGQIAVQQALAGPPPERERALELLDGWLDPLGEVRRLAHRLAKSPSGERRQVLEELQAATAPLQGVLAGRVRQELEAVAPAVPEAQVALVADDLARGRVERSGERLRALELEMLADPRLVRLAEPLEATVAARPAAPSLAPQRERLSAAQIVAQFAAAEERPQSLQRAYLQLAEREQPLTDEARAALAQLASARPEAHILLAEDSARREQPADALLEIGRALQAGASAAPWLHDSALRAWEELRDRATPEVLDQLWQRARSGAEQRRPALAALAMAALDHGLPPGASVGHQADEDEALVADLGALHAGQIAPGAIERVARTSLLPASVVRERVLPRVRELAADALPAGPLFFFPQRRPQLVEVLEAPPTSIYGGRLTSWTWMRGKAPIRLTLVGNAPQPITARVSELVNDLASERSSPSDLVLSGVVSFDFSAPATTRPAEGLSGDRLLERVAALAERLEILPAVSAQLYGSFGRELLQGLAQEPLRPTIASLREGLAQVEQDMGFLTNHTEEASSYDRALDALRRGDSVTSARSFPVILPYRRNGKPLRVRLPLLALGPDHYDRAVEEYRRSVLEGIRSEWRRRSQTYEDWARQSVARYRDLKRDLDRDGPQALGARPLTITARIDYPTARVIPIDPPKVMMALELFEALPQQILNELAYWALAEQRLQSLPTEATFTPHWARGYLVDAFLRGWRIAAADAGLEAACEEWYAQWRPTALFALDRALREHGLSLERIAVENTVFRLVPPADAAADGASVELELLHVFDPCYDAAPAAAGGITLFQPRWGSRRRDLRPAEEAQRRASEIIERALQHTPLAPSALRALSWDSGAALDHLLETICRPLQSPALGRDIARVLEMAAATENPLAVLQQRLDGGPLALARVAGDEGRAPMGLPDLLAFELFVAGQAVADLARSALNGGAPELRQAVPPRSIEALARMSVWEVVRQIVEDGPRARSAITALEVCPLNQAGSAAGRDGPALWLDAARLRETYALLRRREAAYAERCLAGDGFPKLSRHYARRAVPTRFRGHMRAAYHIADGDAALALAWLIRTAGDRPSPEQLSELVARLRGLDIPAALQLRAAWRERLCADLELLDAKDPADLAVAVSRLRHAGREALDAAEAAYARATVIDGRYGDGWVRLARLRWLTGRYRAALDALIGPAPAPMPAACHLPLELAVRLAGAELHIERGDLAWHGPAGVAVEASADGEHLAVGFGSDEGLFGTCEISGLLPADAELLAQLFSDHAPAELSSGGELLRQHGEGAGTFEEWIRLVRVPNIGQRGAIARAVAGEHGAALLAAMAYLGVPPALAAPPHGEAPRRPEEWLDEEVVTAVAWLSQTAQAA